MTFDYLAKAALVQLMNLLIEHQKDGFFQFGWGTVKMAWETARSMWELGADGFYEHMFTGYHVEEWKRFKNWLPEGVPKQARIV